jgi:hypothetical protein
MQQVPLNKCFTCLPFIKPPLEKFVPGSNKFFTSLSRKVGVALPTLLSLCFSLFFLSLFFSLFSPFPPLKSPAARFVFLQKTVAIRCQLTTTGMRPHWIDGSGGNNAAHATYLPRRAVMLLYSGLLHYDCYHAFVGPHPSRPMKRNNRITMYNKIGSTGDYLSNLSANNNERDESEAHGQKSSEAAESSINISKGMSAVANAQSAFNIAASSLSSEMGRRTSEITSGFVDAAEKGGSDFQSFAVNAISSVEKVSKKGTRDVRRTTLLAQKTVKKNTGGLVAAGKGFSDMHFFEVVSFAPRIEATEIVTWIDSQARSGSEMVGSKAKTLVLNFTGKREYRFGDVTKELVHRVVSQEVNMKDWILLLKVSAMFTILPQRNSILTLMSTTFPNALDSYCPWSCDWATSGAAAFHIFDRGTEFIFGTESGR